VASSLIFSDYGLKQRMRGDLDRLAILSQLQRVLIGLGSLKDKICFFSTFTKIFSETENVFT
jgi:hypothetical protein